MLKAQKAGVCSKVMVYLQGATRGSGRQVLKGNKKEAGINRRLLTFLKHGFRSHNISGL